VFTTRRVCGVRVGTEGQCRQERVKTMCRVRDGIPFSESEKELDVLRVTGSSALPRPEFALPLAIPHVVD